MKPVLFGLILGFLLGLVAGVLWFGSLWLPLTAVSIACFAFYYRVRHRASIVPSVWAIGIIGLAYWVMFFGYLEYRAYTAKTAMDHYNLCFAFTTRAQFFPNEKRAFYHLQQTAEMGMQWGEFGLGIAHLEGQYGLPRDKEAARPWLQKAIAQGGPMAERAQQFISDADR